MRRGAALLLLGAVGCSGTASPPDTTGAADVPTPPPAGLTADVRAVSASGAAGTYSFSVTVESPDTGCDRYADWWEVLDAEGRLLYRRILLHSHVDEQPFTRRGGPVDTSAGRVVWVRAHLNLGGYGQAMRGSPDEGFTAATTPPGFAPDVEGAAPQPDGCAF